MCRIFGHFDGDATRDDLRRVAALLRHGGPDAQTCAIGTGWALGSNRLAVMDLAGGAQPYRLDDRITVVFNGEIYNHAELRTRLTARGHHVDDTCDGSVLPALYAEYGPEFTRHLDGMYAVAVMDLRAEPTMLLATDEMSMKPLYYHWDAQRRRLCFASELPALLSFPGVPARPWEPGLDAYLCTRTPFGERTMFEDVRVLPPAATLTVGRSGGLRLHRRPPGPPAPVPADRAEAAALLRERLRTETGRLLRADAPVAVITSGGLDSSLVTALAAGSTARRSAELHSFHIAYTGDWPHDERRFAAEVARRGATRHHEVELDPADLPELLPRVVRHLGQPNADPITVSTYALFAAVSEAGFRVALTGDAADELFGGYDRVRAALEVPDGENWTAGYVDALAAVPRALRQRLYSPDYRAAVGSGRSESDRIAAELAASDGGRLETLTEFETRHRMPAYHLRRVDHLSLASAVEVRLPFCQASVADWARGLPAEWKIGGGRVKRALYEAADGLLPTSVLSRPKQPFTLPIAAMLVPGTALYTFARDVLAPSRLRRSGLLDPAAVDGLFAEQARRPSAPAALALWSLLVHELWLTESGVATDGALSAAGEWAA